MQSLREIVGKIPNYFEHLENNDRLDSDKIKNILLLAFTTYESLLSSYGVQANCKEISGSSISNVKQDSLDFLNAFDTNAYFRSRINDAVLGLDIELIWRWINGETPQHLGVLLSEKYPRLNGKVETATIEAINFIENLQYSIGWPLYAIKVLINFLIEEKVIKGSISPQFDNLPYYLKHGVAHPVSVAIMEKIQNPDFRKDSMLIASGYNVEISYILNHEEIFSSVTDMGEEQISEILKDKTRAKELWGLLMSK
jgi:hypothetical protein